MLRQFHKDGLQAIHSTTAVKVGHWKVTRPQTSTGDTAAANHFFPTVKIAMALNMIVPMLEVERQTKKQPQRMQNASQHFWRGLTAAWLFPSQGWKIITSVLSPAGCKG